MPQIKAAERWVSSGWSILCIEDASHLSEECQELADYLRNKFTRMQDDQAQIESVSIWFSLPPVKIRIRLSVIACCSAFPVSVPSHPSGTQRGGASGIVIKFFRKNRQRLERIDLYIKASSAFRWAAIWKQYRWTAKMYPYHIQCIADCVSNHDGHLLINSACSVARPS